MNTKAITRRKFLEITIATAAGSFFWGHYGCASRPISPAALKSELYVFNTINVEGTSFECGLAIGRQMSSNINRGLKRRSDWFEKLKAFAKDNHKTRIKPYLEAATEHFPWLIEELKGMAKGASLEFEDLFILNIKAELSAMQAAKQNDTPGCSTVVLANQDKLIIAHNEDGDMAYKDLMCLVAVKQSGKPAFIALAYPGILCGNGPSSNSAGLHLTTNYIAGTEVRPGIPRYFLSRAMLQARETKAAIQTAANVIPSWP